MNKGKVFSEADLLPQTRRRLVGGTDEEKARIQGYLSDQTERNRIVAHDGDTPLIAEELQERALRAHAGDDPQVKVVMTTMLAQLNDEQRAAVVAAFDKKGALKIPFKMV